MAKGGSGGKYGGKFSTLKDYYANEYHELRRSYMKGMTRSKLVENYANAKVYNQKQARKPVWNSPESIMSRMNESGSIRYYSKSKLAGMLADEVIKGQKFTRRSNAAKKGRAKKQNQ